jgi:hypothetical protein
MLDEFCIRNLAGDSVGWVFGLSVFSLKGEHIGWFEEGVLYDVHNKVLGFVPAAKGLLLDGPALAPEPAMPALSKRPCAPTLRGRSARPCGGGGWSHACLATYLEYRPLPEQRSAYIPHLPGPRRAGTERSH